METHPILQMVEEHKVTIRSSNQALIEGLSYLCQLISPTR